MTTIRRLCCLSILVSLLLGATLPARCDDFSAVRPLVRIGQAVQAPMLDGRLDDPAWRGAVKIGGFLLEGGVRQPTQQTEVSLCYDRRAIYLAFRCHEDSPQQMKVAAKQRDGEVWRDDCVEVFIAPPGATGYYHLVVNAQGTQYDAYCVQPRAADTRWNVDWKVTTARDPSGWVAEMEISTAALGARGSGDRVWRMNFGREEQPRREISSWSPVRTGFHEPDRFGAVILGKRGPALAIKDWGAKPGSVSVLQATVDDPQRAAKRLLVGPGGGGALASQPLGKSREVKLSYRLPLEGDLLVSASLVNASGDVLFRQTKALAIPPYHQRLREADALLQSVTLQTVSLPQEQRETLASDLLGAENALQSVRQAVAAYQVGDEAAQARVEGAFDLLDYRTRLAAFRAAPVAPPGDLSLERVGACMVASRPAEMTVARYALEQGLALWLKDPWENTSPFDLPEQLYSQTSVALRAAMGEHVPVAVMVTNLGEQSVEARVRLAAASIPASAVTMRRAAYVRRDDGARLTVGDALVKLSDGDLLSVPSNESRQLWLSIDTTGLEPGTYQSSLLVEPLVGYPAQQIPMTLEVLPVALPEKAPVWITTWGGIINIAWAKPDPMAYLRDAAEHGVNVFLVTPASLKARFDPEGNLLGPIDYTEHDELVAAYRPYGMIKGCYSIGDHFDKLAAAAGIAYMSPAYQNAFRTWISDWIGHLRSLGLTYDDFAFELYDEPSGGTRYEHHLAVGKLLKQIDPRARVVITANFVDLIKLEEINPTVDIWVPHVSVLHNDAAREFMKRTGKEMWCYACSGTGKQLAPIGYYRMLPWEARKYRLQGWGYFAHMWWGEDPWQVTNTVHKRGANYSTVYPGSDGPVPSRRWEAYRRGLEDYKLLLLLDRTIVDAQAAGKPADLIAKARTLADQAADRALKIRGDNSAIWLGSARKGQGTELEALREEILDTVAALR